MDGKTIKEITKMRIKGCGYKKIASSLSLPESTVKSFCKKNPLTLSGTQKLEICMNCGTDYSATKKRNSKKFCSNKCRVAWWKSHSEYRGKTKYTCEYCGITFYNYRSKIHKYCSRECYLNSIRRCGDSD